MIDQLTNLDKEEKDLLDSYEPGEWKPVADVESEIERYREYARATIEKDVRVNIRLSTPETG